MPFGSLEQRQLIQNRRRSPGPPPLSAPNRSDDALTAARKRSRANRDYESWVLRPSIQRLGRLEEAKAFERKASHSLDDRPELRSAVCLV